MKGNADQRQRRGCVWEVSGGGHGEGKKEGWLES